MAKSTIIVASLYVFFTLAFSACSTAPPVQVNKPRLVYNYAKLQLLDLDQMNEIIQGKVDRYLETGNKEMLMDAIRICLSRPNGDSLVEKSFDSIRFRANSSNAWESAVDSLIQWAISELKSESTAIVDQVTYLILLENLLAELKLDFINQYQSPKFETRIFEKIAAADIVVSQAANNESRLNLMTSLKSPSARARSMIAEKNLKLKPK